LRIQMFRRRRNQQDEESDPRNTNSVVPGTGQSRGRLLVRLNRALKLNTEHQQVSAGGTWSQLRALNRLMQREAEDEASRAHVDMQILELVQKNPELATCRFKIDDYEEYLIHQIICKQPSVELVVYIYQQNPDAVKVAGYGGYSLLHHACWCHASLEVIQFLVTVDEHAIRAGPFPPLFCAVDKETTFDVMEFLVKSYPGALCTSDISSVTPLDIALMDELPFNVIALFFQYFPNSELRVTEKGGSSELQSEVAHIFASDHEIVRTIDASFMKFTADAQAAFFERLASNKTLIEIVLNLTDVKVNEKVCEAFHQFLKQNNSIKKFSVCGGPMNEALADSMVGGIHSNQTISDLVIEGGLSKGGVESLLAGSSATTNLEKLSLKYTVVHDADWSGLSSFISLQSLDLSNCQIGPPLAKPLAVLLKTTEVLEELFVGRNNIGDEGTVVIAKALQVNNTLRKLEYEKNDIGERGWEALAEALGEFNVCLRFIRFAAEDQFYDKHYAQLVYFCDQNRFGRQILTDKPLNLNNGVENYETDNVVASIPAGESTAESDESVSSLQMISYTDEAESSAEFFEFKEISKVGGDNEDDLEEETIEWS